MDDSQICQMANSLEEAVANCEKKSQVTAADKPSPAWLIVSANRAGCLSLARAFLMAAVEPIEPDRFDSKPIHVPEDDMQIFSFENKRDRIFLWFQRRETWPMPNGLVQRIVKEMRTGERLKLLGCAVFAFAMISLMVSGIVFWCMMLSGEIR